MAIAAGFSFLLSVFLATALTIAFLAFSRVATAALRIGFFTAFLSSFLTTLAALAGFALFLLVFGVGLFFAIIFGVVALGKGYRDHRVAMPAVVGSLGIGIMGAALVMPHGGREILWTIIGVSILAAGHLLNYRASR